MKKKKYEISLGQMVLIILVLIGLILVVKFFVNMLPDIKPQFTIYKEECKNEISWEIKNEVISTEIPEINIGERMTCDFETFDSEYYEKPIKRYACIIYEKEVKEICNKIEVNEIEIKIYNVPSYEYCKTIGFEGLGIASPKGDKFGCIKIISKKDLTKEWLETNCNCLDICEDLKCSNRDTCVHYKCGNYLIKLK